MKLSRNATIIALLVLTVVLLTGCINIKTVVKVNTDGSGTVEQTFLMLSELVAMVAAFSPEGEEFTLLDKDKLAAGASSMGEGVQFVSAQATKENNFEGYKAVYSFKNINSLAVNQNPGDMVPGQSEPSPTEFIRFVFTKASGGSPAKLTINMPQESTGRSAEPATGKEEPSAEDLEAAKQMFQNMKIGLDVQCGTSIVSTTALHRSGNTVTLMDLDFSKITENDAFFQKLMKEDPSTIETLKGRVANLPGIKVEPKGSVEVSFK